jgi:RNA polymerase sigma-70 factor (ECF subfamily)
MKPARYTEDKLMKQFNKGERAALDAVYKMWFPDLCYFAYRITGDLGESEDITSYALQILLSRHTQFETMMNVRAFLYVTVRNRCLDYLNYVKKKNASHKELFELQADNENYILMQMIQGELMKQIYEEIERLPEKRKKVFKLFYIEELDIPDIAKKLGMTPGAVSTTKSRALDQLRAIVSDKKLLPLTGFLVLCFRQVSAYFSSRLFS